MLFELVIVSLGVSHFPLSRESLRSTKSFIAEKYGYHREAPDAGILKTSSRKWQAFEGDIWRNSGWVQDEKLVNIPFMGASSRSFFACVLLLPHFSTTKGRVGLPKRMNFRKTSKGEGEGSFSIQKFMLHVLDLFIGFFPDAFRKWEGGVQRPFGIFQKIYPFW